MVVVHGKDKRTVNSSVVFSDGGFSYRLETEWAQWPDELKGVHVLSGMCDQADNLYVATENPDHPIVQFAPDGKISRSLGKGLFVKAHDLFLTENNTILCADTGDNVHVVREITFDGKLVRDFGEYGKAGNSSFDPFYLDKLKAEGKEPRWPNWQLWPYFYASLETIKGAGKPFTIPCAAAVSKKGEMFVADGYGNCSVHKFSADGQLLKTWGEPGYDPCQFWLPHGIWIDKRDRVWVADRENSRAQVFTTDGELLAIVAGNLYGVADIWSNEDHIYLGELYGGVTILDMELKIVAQIGYHHSQLHVHGLCGNSRGDLYLQTNIHNSNFSNLLKLTRL